MEQFGFIKNDNYNDPSNRYPIGSRDKDYVKRMELLNDSYWKNTERWHYYKVEHQNAILPTTITCFLILFCDNPAISIPMIILFVMFILYMLHVDNKKLDYDPRVQMFRKRSREYRRNCLHMDV